MRITLVKPVKLAGIGFLTWSVALIVCPSGLIAARGQACGGCIGSCGYSSPPASVKVVWTSDWTVSPPQQEASTSGQVGGLSTVHVAFPIPEDMVNATIQSILIHEEAGNVPDVTWADIPFQGDWNPICGDPDPSLPNSPPMLYEDLLWPPPGQNGPYDITVVIACTTATNPEDTSTYTTSDSTLQITVDVENLLITSTTPANPTPILWNPSNATTASLSCNITAAYKANDTVTLSIFDSTQILVWQQPQTLALGGSGGGSASFTWDGSNNQIYNYGSDGPIICPEGVYLFKFEVTNDVSYYTDYDTDKSPFLSVTNTASQILSSDYPSPVDNVQGSCVLTACSGGPLSATNAVLTIYDPNLQTAGSASQSNPTVNASGASPPVPVTFTTTMQVTAPGTYTYLFAAQDDNQDQDKGDRDRYALQHNNAPQLPDTIGFQFVNFPHPPPLNTSPYVEYAATLLAGPLHDQSAYLPDPTQSPPGVATGQAANQTSLGLIEKAAIADVFTHGGTWINGVGIHSWVQFWDGNNWSYIVRTDAAKSAILNWRAGTSIICLDDLVATPPAQPVFSKMLFALLEGCYTTLSVQDTLLDNATTGAHWGDPALGFVEDGGADCALGFKNEIFSHTIAGLPTPNPTANRTEGYGAEEWHVFFWQACCQQGMTISAAARYASKLAASPTNGLYGYRIAGTPGLTIEPARYGP